MLTEDFFGFASAAEVCGGRLMYRTNTMMDMMMKVIVSLRIKCQTLRKKKLVLGGARNSKARKPLLCIGSRERSFQTSKERPQQMTDVEGPPLLEMTSNSGFLSLDSKSGSSTKRNLATRP